MPTKTTDMLDDLLKETKKAAPPKDTKKEKSKTVDLSDIQRFIGEERKIGVYKPTWDEVREHLLVMRLHIEYFRGETQLHADDFGLIEKTEESGFNKFLNSYIQLGRKRLIPEELYRDIKATEARLRSAFDRYTFRSPAGRLITPQAYKLWKEETAADRGHFEALRDRMVNEYDGFLDKLRNDYRAMAVKKWQVQNPNDRKVPDEFIWEEVERIVGHFPSKDAVGDSFKIYWDLEYLQSDTMTVQYAQQELDRLESDKEQVEREMTDLRERIIEAEDAEKLSLRRREMQLEAERNRLERETEIRLEMAQQVQRTWANQVENTIEFFGKELNQILYNVASDVLVALSGEKDKGRVRGKLAITLKNWVKEIRSLNFLEDSDAGRQIDRMISEVEEFINPVSKSAKTKDQREEDRRRVREIQEITAAYRLTTTNLDADVNSLIDSLLSLADRYIGITSTSRRDTIRQEQKEVDLEAFAMLTDRWREGGYEIDPDVASGIKDLIGILSTYIKAPKGQDFMTLLNEIRSISALNLAAMKVVPRSTKEVEKPGKIEPAEKLVARMRKTNQVAGNLSELMGGTKKAQGRARGKVS